MDPNVEELEKQFLVCSDLLRVRTYVSQVRNEQMDPGVMKIIIETYNIIEQLKDLSVKIAKLDNIGRLRRKRDEFMINKTELIEEVKGFILYLESKTNVLSMPPNSDVLTILQDLEEATLIFIDELKNSRKRTKLHKPPSIV